MSGRNIVFEQLMAMPACPVSLCAAAADLGPPGPAVLFISLSGRVRHSVDGGAVYIYPRVGRRGAGRLGSPRAGVSRRTRRRPLPGPLTAPARRRQARLRQFRPG